MQSHEDRPLAGSRRADQLVRAGLVVGLLLLVACAPSPTRTEVLRVPSPDGALDAVVVQTNAGATTPFGYLLSIVHRGCASAPEPVLRVVGATRSSTAAGVGLRWTGARELVVTFLDARFAVPDPPVIDGDVRVGVRSGVADPAAPPGAMPATGRIPSC